MRIISANVQLSKDLNKTEMKERGDKMLKEMKPGGERDLKNLRLEGEEGDGLLEIKFDREREVRMEELREGKQVEGFRWKREAEREVRVRWLYYS